MWQVARVAVVIALRFDSITLPDSLAARTLTMVMKTATFLAVAVWIVSDASAFGPAFLTPPPRTTTTATGPGSLLSMSNDKEDNNQSSSSWWNGVVEQGHKAVVSGVLAATLWSLPAMNVPLPFPHHQGGAPVMTAQAKEMASGTGSRVNKDAESLLRYGLPINNKEVS